LQLLQIIYFQNIGLKLYAHGMRPVHLLGACVWFRDITSFSDASGIVCVQVEVSQSCESDAST